MPTRSAIVLAVSGCLVCAGGPATDEFDQLTPIVDWVERDRPPVQIVGTVNAPGHR